MNQPGVFFHYRLIWRNYINNETWLRRVSGWLWGGGCGVRAGGDGKLNCVQVDISQFLTHRSCLGANVFDTSVNTFN